MQRHVVGRFFVVGAPAAAATGCADATNVFAHLGHLIVLPSADASFSFMRTLQWGQTTLTGSSGM